MNPFATEHNAPILLLGPQPRDFSDVADAVKGFDTDGPVALITAGWQENEPDHSALVQALGRKCINLELHARSEEVAARQKEFVSAWARRQKHLRHLQEFYRVRLEAVEEGARTIAVRHVAEDLLTEQREITVSQFRHLDEEHLRRCLKVCRDFEEQWPFEEQPALVQQREEVAAILKECSLLVISGGHVVALLNRLRLFDIPSLLGELPIVAWSAGAMTLTDRIVLFHDSPPFGKNLAQLLDFGLGLCPGIVALPDMSRRVNLDHRVGIGRFARRMAPAQCLGLDPGARVLFKHGELIEISNSARMNEFGLIEWRRTP